MDSGPGPRVFVGVDGAPPGLAALRFAADEARRRGAPLYAVRVTAQLTLRAAKQIEAAFAEAVGGVPDDVVVNREVLIGPIAETLTRRARLSTDVLIVGTDGGRQRRGVFGTGVFGSKSVSQACLRGAQCPVFVVPASGLAVAETAADRVVDPAVDQARTATTSVSMADRDAPSTGRVTRSARLRRRASRGKGKVSNSGV